MAGERQVGRCVWSASGLHLHVRATSQSLGTLHVKLDEQFVM